MRTVYINAASTLNVTRADEALAGNIICAITANLDTGTLPDRAKEEILREIAESGASMFSYELLQQRGEGVVIAAVTLYGKSEYSDSLVYPLSRLRITLPAQAD